jgi:hypothetical protein
MKWSFVIAVTVAAAIASAQPATDEPPAEETAPPPPPAPPVKQAQPEPEPPAPPPKPARKPDPRVDLPQLITAPTGWLLPAAVIYSRTGLDTGGGVTSDNRVGLGDVAEFGLSTLDQIRVVQTGTDPGAPPDRIQPYFAATFRLGVAEDRLFAGQPGLVLGFRKSFERAQDNFKTRVAELTLVASKKIGTRAAIHAGGAFWDASLSGTNPDGSTVDTTLHGMGSLANQIRAFGGVEMYPFEKSEIMVDVSWAPTFCYQCAGSDQIRLRPELAWGVRYDVANWMKLESGVRVPDIGSANLLDAQIFGQITFVTWGLRHAIDSLK